MAPVISIVGRSRSGKTTLISNLIRELKTRGYRVATVKHTPLGMSVDNQKKNSQSHIEAGAEAVVMCDRTQMVLMQPTRRPAGLAEAVRLLGDDYDIILAEGFKQDEAPKIEVRRVEVGPPLANLKKVFAVVSDEKSDTKIRQFVPAEYVLLADLIEEGFIKPQLNETRLEINGNDIALSAFPRDFINQTVKGMTRSLKGVNDIRTLKIVIKQDAGKTG